MKMFTKKEMAAIALLEILTIINAGAHAAGPVSLFFMMLGPVLLVLASRLFV